MMANVEAGAWLLAVPVDFAIALSRIRFSHHLLVKFQAEEVTGTGEGVLYRTLPYQAAEQFRRLAGPGRERGDLLCQTQSEQEAWVSRLASTAPALAYAVDTALWDVRAKQLGRRVADLLGGPRRERIPITEQVFIRDWPAAEKELDAILSRGTRQIKIKIGADPRRDLEFVRRTRVLVGPATSLRVDVNRAYTLAQAEHLYRALADLGVAALEEPLSVREGWSGLRTLRQRAWMICGWPSLRMR